MKNIIFLASLFFIFKSSASAQVTGGKNFTVYFESNKAALTPLMMTYLEMQVDFLNKHPEAKATITGYADCRGSNEYNTTLSMRRARAFADYLLSRGINPIQLRAVWHGESHADESCCQNAGLCDDSKLKKDRKLSFDYQAQ